MVGHIEGGHLSRLANAKKKAGKEALIGSILGGAAAVLGNPAVGTAIAAGGAHIGTRSLLKFNRRTQSLRQLGGSPVLGGHGQSAQGLADFLNMLVDQELLSTSSQDPYVRTHPLSRQRIDLINNHLAKSRYREVLTTKAFVILHNRMRAKLAAFLQPPVKTLKQYPKKDQSLEARYARAIAYYKRPRLDRALPIIDGLIKDHPNDPFFHELRGQMLFENGRIGGALPSYERAALLLPASALLRGDLARVQLAIGEPRSIAQSTVNFRAALRQEPRNTFYWRQLGIAYGKLDRVGESSLHLKRRGCSARTKCHGLKAGRAAKKLPARLA